MATPNTTRRDRILIVDDEPDVLEALRDALHAYLPEIDISVAPSGPDALRALKEEHVDLIISDYRMPDMNGLEFLALAREVAPTVPRIMITAYPDLDLAIRGLNQEHISHFITKPLRPRQVVEAVTSVFEERRSARQRNNALVAALQAMRGQGHT